MATGASGVVNRPTIVSLFLICALSSNIIAQSRTEVVNGDSLTIFTQPMRNNFEEKVTGFVSKSDSIFSYEFEIYSGSDSKQKIWFWTFFSDAKILSHTSPEGWKFLNRGVPKRVAWGSESNSFEIKPNSLLEGFKIISSYTPTIKNYYMEGWVQFILDEEPDSVENSSFFDVAKKGTTIFPRVDVIESSESFTDTLETFRFRSCEELDWATNSGVCGELENELYQIKTALQKKDSVEAIHALSTFIELVEQEKDKSLTSEGYSLLFFNAEYLRKRLAGEDH
jgi:hypothetical protein